jgi:hypothetical protein
MLCERYVQPNYDDSVRFNSGRSKTAKLGGMGDVAVENISFMHGRGDSMRLLCASFRQMRPRNEEVHRKER